MFSQNVCRTLNYNLVIWKQNESEPLPMLTDTLVFPVTSQKTNKIMQDYIVNSFIPSILWYQT